MRRAGALAGAAIAALVATGCGDQRTLTVTSTQAASTVWAATTAAVPPTRASRSAGKFRHCDANITAKKVTTSCPFAENVFLEYFVSGSADSVTAYSPARERFYKLRCTESQGHVRCGTYTGAVIKFPASAIAAYTSAQAQAYIDSADVGPGPRPVLGSTSDSEPTTPQAEPEPDPIPESSPAPYVPPASEPDAFCDTHDCIPNYDNGNGSTVQCADGSYSQSGGIQGACSHHGGVG